MRKPSRSLASRQSLEEAHRQLTLLADAHREEDGRVPPWIVAAKLSVRAELESGDHD